MSVKTVAPLRGEGAKVKVWAVSVSVELPVSPQVGMNEYMTVQSDVIELVAEQGGLKREKVSMTSRLFHDLGFDGDDAVELFEAFQQRFDVELTPLYDHWSSHFGPEGFEISKGSLRFCCPLY